MAQKTFYEKIAQAKLELDLAKARYDQLVDVARENLEYGSHSEGDVTVQVSVNRRWNKKRALEVHGDKICTPQVDQSLAKDVLTGTEYNELYDEGAPRIVVKLA